jgi:hypothetical protein
VTVPSEESDQEFLTSGFAHALGVSANEEIRRYVATGHARLPAGASLLAWDANSVHGYVFDTTNATCIRGASTRLRDVDEDLLQGGRLGLIPQQILYSGGGSGMAVIPAAQAVSVETRLHEVFAEKTRIATCTTAAVPLIEEEEGFQGRVQAVFRARARNRFLTGSDGEASVPFFALRCAVCGHRAAAESVPRVAVPDGRPECEACRERIEAGRDSRRDGNEPSDFQDLSDRSEGGFYAVVYSDGNGVGRLLRRLKSPLEYMRVSREIDHLLGTTVKTLARRYGLAGDGEEAPGEPRPRRGRPRGRYQLPICGGDDVVAILPGEVALPFARDLVRALQAGADASPVLGGEKLGASAGVAISNVKFPIRHLLTEAEGLLKLAKRRVYADGVRSSLSFSVITDGSPRAESVTPERWARRDEEEILLSGRPYGLEELETFSRRVRTLRDSLQELGKSQLYILLRHAHAGPAQLRSHVLYQVGRREEWRQLVQGLSGRDAGILTDPSACVEAVIPEYGKRRVFDVADILEVFDHWSEPEEESEP